MNTIKIKTIRTISIALLSVLALLLTVNVIEGTFAETPDLAVVFGTAGDRDDAALWEMTADGILTVGSGSISSATIQYNGDYTTVSPFPLSVRRIIFTVPVAADSRIDLLFFNLRYLETIENIQLIDTSSVTTMNHVFWLTPSLTSLDGVSEWDTSNVTDMSGMFRDVGVNSIGINLDLARWDVENITDMSRLFEATRLNDLNITSWRTGNVTDMSSMFASTYLTTLDLSFLDTSSVIDMSGMFSDAISLRHVNVSSWDVSNVTNMIMMFHNTNLMHVDLSGWDTRNVSWMNNMFTQNRDPLTDYTRYIRAITLGSNFRFSQEYIDGLRLNILPDIPVTAEFTGYWQNVGNGTPETPLGQHVFTSAQLVANFNGATMADMFIWQQVHNPEPTPTPTPPIEDDVPFRPIFVGCDLSATEHRGGVSFPNTQNNDGWSSSRPGVGSGTNLGLRINRLAAPNNATYTIAWMLNGELYEEGTNFTIGNNGFTNQMFSRNNVQLRHTGDWQICVVTLQNDQALFADISPVFPMHVRGNYTDYSLAILTSELTLALTEVFEETISGELAATSFTQASWNHFTTSLDNARSTLERHGQDVSNLPTMPFVMRLVDGYDVARREIAAALNDLVEAYEALVPLGTNSGGTGGSGGVGGGTSSADGWIQSNNQWFYYQNGQRQTGWVRTGGSWFFMDDSGVMQTGWIHDGNGWYFLRASGRMRTGWLRRGTRWYFLNDSGRMQTGQVVINGETHQFRSNGRWIDPS